MHLEITLTPVLLEPAGEESAPPGVHFLKWPTSPDVVFQVPAGQVLDDDTQLRLGEDQFAEEHQVGVVQKPVLHYLIQHFLAYRPGSLREPVHGQLHPESFVR